MKKIILSLSFIFLFAACSSTSVSFDNKYNYKKTISDNTQHEKKYSGISNTYQVSVTHLSPKVFSLKDQKLAFLQQWPSHKVEEASQKQEETLAKNTTFIVILYTPVVKNNDLKKGDDSIWRTYLEVNGQRVPGIAIKAPYKPSQVSTLFPTMTRFSKAYQVQFPIAENETSSGSGVKFILTSDLGTSEFTF